MPERVTLTIPGEPVGWGRPTPVARLNSLGEPYVMMVTQDQTRRVKAAVLAAFRRKYPSHRPWTGPVLLRFTAVFETPKSFNKALKAAAARGELYATKKPDKDNIEKLIKDALNGVVFVDDQQVMGGGIKRYGSPARVEISFETLNSADVPEAPSQKRTEQRLQQSLDLRPQKPRRAKETKSVLRTDLKVEPDTSGWSPRQRELIEAAMRRDEEARRKRLEERGT